MSEDQDEPAPLSSGSEPTFSAYAIATGQAPAAGQARFPVPMYYEEVFGNGGYAFTSSTDPFGYRLSLAREKFPDWGIEDF